MLGLSITLTTVDGLRRFDQALQALAGPQLQVVASRALNRAGDISKTQVTRALTGQTGLRRGVIVKAIGKPKPARGADLTYVMKAQGGDVSLKYFDARETRIGVSAKPFGKRRVFAGTFIKAGRFPGRVAVPALNGHVFMRAGSTRFPIEKQRSGVIIPAEMVKGATAEAFERSVAINLPRRIEHELRRLTGGALT